MVGADMASRRRLEPLEPHCKTVPIWAVFYPPRQMEGSAIQPFESFEHLAVVLPEQAPRHVQTVIWVDSDEMRVERGVMDFRERDAVGNHRPVRSRFIPACAGNTFWRSWMT